jgi:hypothetical protein
MAALGRPIDSGCPMAPSVFLRAARFGLRATATFMKTTKQDTFAVGKYLVSPLVTRTDSGRYAASVSIRSGQGSATHHRVLRFVPRFDTRDIAQRYAVDHGLAWLQRTSHTS